MPTVGSYALPVPGGVPQNTSRVASLFEEHIEGPGYGYPPYALTPVPTVGSTALPVPGRVPENVEDRFTSRGARGGPRVRVSPLCTYARAYRRVHRTTRTRTSSGARRRRQVTTITTQMHITSNFLIFEY